MLRHASIAVLALVLAGPALAQTSKKPGAPIRVMLDAPKPAEPKAVTPATPAQVPAPAAAKPAQTAPRAAAKSTPEPKQAEMARRAEAPETAKPQKSRAKPKKLPPFPKLERGKPETYRKAIEAWRDLLEEQRVARGGGRYPSYTQALARYQQGVDLYFIAIGRPRDKKAAEPEKKAD